MKRRGGAQLHPIIAQDIERVLRVGGNLWSPLQGSRILVTGAAGMVPAYFLHTIAQLNRNSFIRPCRVDAYIHRPLSPGHPLEYLRGEPWIRFVAKDVGRPFSINRDIRFIVHAASLASPSKYLKDPLGTLRANVCGTETILEHARRHPSSIRGILFMSSGELYGEPNRGDIPTPEHYRGRTDHLAPRACYVESKRFAEVLCAVYHRQHNVPVSIARPVHVYGPGVRLQDGRVWADFLGSAIRREPIRMLSDGRARRSFCYVADAIFQLWNILLQGRRGEAYNVGYDGADVSILELAQEVARLACYKESPLPIERHHPTVSYTSGSPTRSIPDMTKTRSAFRLPAPVSLRAGLRRTLAWCRDHYSIGRLP